MMPPVGWYVQSFTSFQLHHVSGCTTTQWEAGTIGSIQVHHAPPIKVVMNWERIQVFPILRWKKDEPLPSRQLDMQVGLQVVMTMVERSTQTGKKVKALNKRQNIHLLPFFDQVESDAP
eukprot:Skav206254  [mRNA]  locus=scaffold1425:375110:376324:- [translate_table: standard]